MPRFNHRLDARTTATFIPNGIWTGIAMTEDTHPPDTDGNGQGDLEVVADRLEAALDRIARHLDAARPAPVPAELAARLDRLISRLRLALGGASGPAQGSNDGGTEEATGEESGGPTLRSSKAPD
jgi:hypothetical protein